MPYYWLREDPGEPPRPIVVGQLEEATDGRALKRCVEGGKRAGEVPTRAGGRGSCGSVVPARGGPERGSGSPLRKADEQLFDQQPVIGEDRLRGRCARLLVGQIRVADGGDRPLVAVAQDTP